MSDQNEPARGVGRRDYAERRASRIARLEHRAAKLKVESAAAFKAVDRIAAIIPLGQPILVGHHSEGRHRRDLAKIDSGMRKGIATAKEAETLERRAAFAESNQAISSDDPDAIEKLKAKLVQLEKTRGAKKRANEIIRKAMAAAKKAGTDPSAAAAAALSAEFGWKLENSAKLVAPDFAGRIGFASYELTNSSAERRRIETRIKVLETSAARPEAEETVGDVRIVQADNRVQLFFPSKPADAVRKELKCHGFRWAPSVEAWQRLYSEDALYYARRIVAKLGAGS